MVGWCDGAGLTSSAGASYNFDYSRARAYCACSRCGVGVGVVWTFLLPSILSLLSPSLWETARYRLKYCLKRPLHQKQPTTNQGQGPTVLAVGADGVCLDIFTLIYPFPFLFPSLWEKGGAMVLGKLPVPGRPTILITEGQGPAALAVGAGGGCLDIFTLIFPFFPLCPSLWETARYRLKYCPKPTNSRARA